MKRVILVCLLLFAAQLQARHRQLTLQKALELKLVKAKASSLGGYQGYCIHMSLKNLSPDSLLVTIEPGRRLNSTDDKFQDILVIKEELITLKKGAEKSFDVKGYCCQASNCAPSKNAVYDVNKMADSNLVSLARYLNRNCFSADVEQHAIWAISNNHLTANITSPNDSSLAPLRQLISALKGEVPPWYTLICSTYMFPSGRIENYPLVLRGQLKYSNDKEDYVTLYVFNEKGRQVCLVKSQWLKPGDNLAYDLNIPVKGLDKGKYTIALKTAQRELASQEFEIGS